jgi:hypothetical protein
LVRWSRYRDVTEIDEWPSSLEMVTTSTPAARSSSANVCLLCGIPHKRHTFASECLSNGLSLAKTAAYLGDTQQVVLATYSHFMPTDEDRARDILNGFFAPRDGRADALRMPPAVGEEA